MLHIKATSNINFGPFSFRRTLKGAKYPSCLCLIFSVYEPKTISRTPIKPKKLGNSPTIKGEVNKRNNGVKVSNGIVMDKSEYFIAFI